MLTEPSASVQRDPGYVRTNECFKTPVGLQTSKGHLQGKKKDL